MASLISSIVRSQIRLLSPLIQNATLEQTRAAQDALSRLTSRAVRGSVRFRDKLFPFFDASWAIPIKGRVRQAIVYLHGGAYTAGGLPYAQAFGGVLAQMTGRATLCVGYRLAPEDPYPAALEDALASYLEALRRFSPEDIALVGESAGGGLCYSLALKLKELQLPLPERIVAISPWVDLAMEGDYLPRQRMDFLLSADNLRESARMYADGAPLRDPLISPRFGDLSGLPPSLLFAGGNELLLPDSEILHQKLLNTGCESELHIAEGLWHVYVLYGVPEARDAMQRIKLYLTGGKHNG